MSEWETAWWEAAMWQCVRFNYTTRAVLKANVSVEYGRSPNYAKTLSSLRFAHVNKLFCRSSKTGAQLTFSFQ